jgi:iron(III) transport system ATP-binding protein
MTELDVVGLTNHFGNVPVLRGVDLHVPSGSLTAVLGPSGCGKTTLLRLIAGFDRPDAGAIRLGDRVLFEPGRSVPPERRHIGYVAQEGALFPHLTVAKNITFGLAWRDRRARRRVAELLTLVGLDESYAKRFPHQLSGGQQQRVALARALAPRPAVILLDEPFSSLDASLRDSTRRAVAAALDASKTTTILVTHDQAEALSMADQVAVMQEGRFTQTASPLDLYRAPVDAETARFVGDAVVLSAEVRDGAAETELGALRLLDRAAAGVVSVLVRPEQVAITDADRQGVAHATVEGVTFYGHDAMVELVLSTGTTVLSRCQGHRAPARGTEVGVEVVGPVHVFDS